ncbi:MAG TPA: glycosyltransferase family 2 protein [Verrucomicrobiae bacterium]|jgi:glycosyltransferase involved in cell wall biosynthesis|nr:glycosyltransferase family 2 protein [Verrucomicrobiae bacterium]
MTPQKNSILPPPAGKTGWPWISELPVAEAIRQNLPKITIVTPSYNQGEFIEETIRSVLLQGYPNLEYIIMDGGSKDNTVEIIKKYSDHIDFWLSEKDRGQSHAINKGIARCTGEIFNWINSDDLLMPGALRAVAKAWQQNPDTIISGSTEIFDHSGTLSLVKASGQNLRNFVRFWEAPDFQWTQQATFIPLVDVKVVGGLREELIYCMDYDLMVKVLMRGRPVTYTDQVLARFRSHALSKTIGAKKNFRLERVNALRQIKNLPIKVMPCEWDAEQARRMVDMARHAWKGGEHVRAMKWLSNAFTINAKGAMGEMRLRTRKKLMQA